MKRKKTISSLLMVMLLVCAMVFTSACGNSSSEQANSGSKEKGEAPGEKEKLVVANWQSYATDAEYGEPAFEELYGCEVEHYFISSIPELMSVLENGGIGNIDVVCINPLYLQQYQNAGVLQTIDVSKLQNYENLREDFRTIDEVKDADGNIIGVPWVWGTTSLFYNADVIEEEITSWSAFWDPKYAGMVTLENKYDTAIRTAAMYIGEDPGNPDMEKVEGALGDLKSNIKTFWTSHDDFIKAFTSGEVAIGNVWGSIATELQSEGMNIKYVYPEEGTVGWCDYWCIVKDTKHEDLAMKWIDYCTGEQFQSSMATGEGQVYCPVNTTVTENLTDEAKQSLWIYPEAPSNIHLAHPLDDETLKTWTSAWDKIKAGS